jgi:hypothetical protein
MSSFGWSSERCLPFSISGSSALNGARFVAITVALRREHSLAKSELFDVEGDCLVGKKLFRSNTAELSR